MRAEEDIGMLDEKNSNLEKLVEEHYEKDKDYKVKTK